MSEGHGGKREGAGRPLGSKNQRTLAVLEILDEEINNPIVNLLRLSKLAEEEGDLKLAFDCAKALLPYYLPKQKPISEDVEDITRPIVIHTTFPVPGSRWGEEPPEDLKNY